MSVDVLKDFFYKFLDLDQWNSSNEEKEQVEKLMNRIIDISTLILKQSAEVDKTKVKALQLKACSFENFSRNLNQPLPAQTEATNFSDDSD